MPNKLGLGLHQIVLVRLGNPVVDMGKEICADGHRSRLYSPSPHLCLDSTGIWPLKWPHLTTSWQSVTGSEAGLG